LYPIGSLPRGWGRGAQHEQRDKHDVEEHQATEAGKPPPAETRGHEVTFGEEQHPAGLTSASGVVPLGQGPRKTCEQRRVSSSCTQPTPISVSSGSSMLARWPAESSHASITSAAPAELLTRFSAAVVSGSQARMTGASEACSS